MSNEAAERPMHDSPRNRAIWHGGSSEAEQRLRHTIGTKIGLAEPLWVPDLDAALAAERHATVERMQSNVRLVLLRHHVSDEDVATCDVCSALRRAILDEEAAR